MSLSEEERYALVSYRVEKAHATFEQAKANVANGYWDLIANRLYYAVYYATSALLLQNGYSVQTHNGIIQMLGLHFIKNRKAGQKMGQYIQSIVCQPSDGRLRRHVRPNGRAGSSVSLSDRRIYQRYLQHDRKCTAINISAPCVDSTG